MNIPIDFIIRYLNIFHFSSSLPKLIFQSTPNQYLHRWNCCYSPHQILPLLLVLVLVLVLPPQLHRARRGGGGVKIPPPHPTFLKIIKSDCEKVFSAPPPQHFESLVSFSLFSSFSFTVFSAAAACSNSLDTVTTQFINSIPSSYTFFLDEVAKIIAFKTYLSMSYSISIEKPEGH